MTAGFELRGEHITLEALIKAADLDGRREQARAAIAAGAVRVNGETETRRGRKLRAGDEVRLGAETVRLQQAGGDTQ